ncbi:hypothetical protein [Azospirillum brasilense]|uniref:hypothetical protein n=1 Tax=Azospirillum brasilense TaxID=192 RepID=UPI000E0C8530|nr:hypothetical protein [Azospirillum brasilense]
MTAPDGYPFAALTEADAGFFPSARSVGAPPAIPYRVSCARVFAEAVVRLAVRRGTDLSALTAAALLLVPDRTPDPGTPPQDDAERAVLELRLPPGHSDAAIRRSLAAALALAEPGCRLMPAEEAGRLEGAVETLTYRNKALAHALERVSFRPLDGKLTQVRDAAQMFGFVNEWCFDEDRVVKRFRELAPVYHPDTGVVACRDRMAQLIDARNLLINHVRTAYRSGPWTRRS